MLLCQLDVVLSGCLRMLMSIAGEVLPPTSKAGAFWALAIHRRDEYAKAGIPMLPVTHGVELTKALVWYYTVLLGLVTLLPYLVGMSGIIYLTGACIFAFLFAREAWILKNRDKPGQAMKTFGFSLVYLLGLFAALLVDHIWIVWMS